MFHSFSPLKHGSPTHPPSSQPQPTQRYLESFRKFYMLAGEIMYRKQKHLEEVRDHWWVVMTAAGGRTKGLYGHGEYNR